MSSLFACLMQECQDPPKGLAMKAHRIGSKDPPTRWSSYRTSGPSPVRMKHGAAPPRRSKSTDGTTREPDPDSGPDPDREPVRWSDVATGSLREPGHDRTQTRAVWDCHRTADQLTFSTTPGLIGSPNWQSHGSCLGKKKRKKTTGCVWSWFLDLPNSLFSPNFKGP